MIIRIVLFLLCATGLFNVPAHAQLFLEQAKVSLSVSAGEHLNGAILIHNTTSNPITLKVYWEDFEYKPPYDGSKIFLPAGTGMASASQWVTFFPQTFTIPPYGQQNIDYAVTVPGQIQEGHYGVLFFERTSTEKVNADNISIVTRIGSLFFIEPKDKVKKSVLQDIQLKSKGITASFVNQGNVVLIPRTTFYIMQEGGLVLFRGEIKKVYVPPGASASLEIPLNKKLSQGHYTLVVNSDLEDGDVLIKEIGLSVDASGQLTMVNSQD